MCIDFSLRGYNRSKKRPNRAASTPPPCNAKILNDDEAFEAFGKSLSFVQQKSLSSSKDNDAKEAALFALRPFAQRSPDAFLIQTMIKSADKGSMAKVITAIQKLIAKIKAQLKEEVAFRDSCIDELDDIDGEMRV